MRRQNMVDRVTEDAQALLRAAQDIHAERHGARTFTQGVTLLLEGAAERTGIRSDGIRYHDAVAELEYEGAIEWDTSARYARGNKHYVITRRGLDELGRVRGEAIQEGQEEPFEA